MGYYSVYTVEVDQEPEDFEHLLEKVSGGYSFYSNGDGEYQTDNVKWYDYRENIAKLSKQLPEVAITVTRESEDGEGAKYTVIDGVESRRFKRGWVEDNG